MQQGLALSGFLLASAALAAQEQAYRYGHLSHVEGEVSLQRASETEPEAASLNVPFLPGDRVWTRAGSRAEIRFESGLIVHLSESAKLDFVAGDTETILRLWSGSAILRVADSETLRVDTAAGSIRPTGEGSYRIDIDSGDVVTLSVERGSAELSSSLGTVLVQSGETSFATPSNPPSIPATFNTARVDEFDRWSDARVASRSRTEDIVVKSLPHAVRTYVYDLDDHGDWHHEPDYGYVWYPRVEVGWAPYAYGYWGYWPFGHTWISYEPWGWAPYHYGRWGYGHRGWYWIPGAVWGPAWVSFALGPTWVGWSPLAYYGGPVFAFNTYYGGYGSRYYWGRGWPHRGGWNVCSRDDFDKGVVTREGYRRLEPESVAASVEKARLVNEVSSLDRDFNVREAPVRPAASVRGASASSAEASARREAALRGFRERSLVSSPRVLDDGGRTTSRRDDFGRRARELRAELERWPSHTPERRDVFERSGRSERTFEAPETIRSYRSASWERQARSERREPTVGRVRETEMGPMTRGSSRAGAGSRESHGARLRSFEPSSETRSVSGGRVERAEPRATGSRSRDGSGAASFRERGSPQGHRGPSVRGESGGGSRGSRSPTSSAGSARPRSRN
jgi:ferric-dicitrate binding protein FerR (iron transport regulator)